MSNVGKKLRMSQIFRGDGRSLIFAFDHGAFMGPTKGSQDAGRVLAEVIGGGADAVMTTLGIIKNYAPSLARKGLGWILTLQDRSPQTVVESVSTASRLGVDAVKLFVTMGTENQQRELEVLWALTRAAEDYGMPVLAEMYPVKSEKTPNPLDPDNIRRVSRIAAEYGADFIKTFYTGSVEDFRTVVEACPIPIVVLGGEKADSDLDFLEAIASSIKAGGSGAAVGRNIFDHPSPGKITEALAAVIHQGVKPIDAVRLLT
ncbi:3-hydroxy-5-phosphonooxypentane-2,4-dione thiolase [archaeon HR01]|nr:3-hydroxy-5-phosphonooxypentane-2,4-dione thiolase [archaeon HR01]